VAFLRRIFIYAFAFLDWNKNTKTSLCFTLILWKD